ncbi:Glutamate/aspartate import solute-binding protein [compost metagenome]
MLESGRAVAFMMDDVLLYGEMVKARKPDDWAVVGTPQSFEIYGCMLRKDDPAFKQVVDDVIRATYQSGEINAIYDKWFHKPVPPKGLNLNFPMSEQFKKLIAEPTDKSAEQR